MGILILFELLATVLFFETSAAALSAKDYRLPRNIKPTSYELTIKADPRNETFDGVVKISFQTASENGSAITAFGIHAPPEFIKITSFRVASIEDCRVLSQNNVTEIAVVNCSTDISKFVDKAKVFEIKYQGKFSTEDMYGFYKSIYDENGTKKTLVSTQFEQTFARRAFPCFDEPEFKATFTLSITYPSGYVTLANTKAANTTSSGTTKTSVFKTTPKMSTYLIAFAISEFKEFNNTLDKSHNFGVYARPGAADYSQTAVNYGPKLLDLLSNWTGIPYSTLGNDKMNFIAIPDFAGGAMENWGLITYREVYLLDEGIKTSALVKQNVITVIVHELAHQWFGDYVTLDWWSDTWLNEGFATYLQYYIPNELTEENMELDKQFVTNVQQRVLQADSLSSTQPLSSNESTVYTPAQSSKKFGSISYSKGASVLRMVKYIIGEYNFRTSLQAYLQKYKYSNTNPTNLLNELQTVVTDKNVNLTQNLHTWIYESGFPLIKVSLDNSSEGFVTITTEKQFLRSNGSNDAKEWFVPISHTSSKSPDFETINITWLEPDSNISLDIDSDEWVIVNIQASGFYRVNYDTTLWSRIITALKTEKQRNTINVLNRAQLIDDVFNIASIGDVEYSIAFELAEYLQNESEYYPWYSAFTAFSILLDKMDNKTSLQELILKLVENIVDISSTADYSSQKLSHVDTLKKVLVLEWACKLKHSKCVKYAKDQFLAYKTNSSSLTDYNLRNLIFCNGLRYSQNASGDFNFLFDVYETSNSPNEKTALINSLACTEDPTILLLFLQKTIVDNSSIRKQDAAKVFSEVYSTSSVGVNVALNFLELHLDKMATAYKGMSAIHEIITGLAKKLTTEESVTKLKKILTQHQDIEEVVLAQDQANDIVESNLKWVATYSKDIQAVLDQINNGTTTTAVPVTTHNPNCGSRFRFSSSVMFILVFKFVYNRLMM